MQSTPVRICLMLQVLANLGEVLPYAPSYKASGGSIMAHETQTKVHLIISLRPKLLAVLSCQRQMLSSQSGPGGNIIDVPCS